MWTKIQTNNINIYREEHNIEHNMLVDGCDIEAIICRFRIIIWQEELPLLGAYVCIACFVEMKGVVAGGYPL